MGFLKGLGVVVGCLVVVFGFVWLAQGNDFFMYKVFAPAKANVEREVFENSDSFVRGTNADIQAYYLEYVKADPEHKAAIKAVVLEKTAKFPEEQMSETVRRFVHQLRAESGI
jgi:hypothetical protein